MRTILITGASSGIGRSCAERLAEGNQLILCSRNTKKIETLVAELPQAMGFCVDVRNKKEVDDLFSSLKKQEIFPDVIINSAGLALGLEDLEESNALEWDQMLDTNVKGLLYVSSCALKEMKRFNVGQLINIGSIAGINPYARGVVYAASKAAVKSISDGLRKEVVAHNIKITNIQPGLVETNFSKIRFRGNQEAAEKVYKGIKPLSPEDISDVVAFVINTPAHVQINEITVTPVHQASVEVIYRTI